MNDENRITQFQADMIIRCLCEMAQAGVEPGRLNIIRATLIHNCRKVNAEVQEPPRGKPDTRVIETRPGWFDVIFGA